MDIYLSLVVCIVGLVIYVLPTEAKINNLGINMFWTGLLAFLLRYGGMIR